MDSAGKRKVTKPMHGPPLQARVAAANRTVLQLANCWFDDPGAHGMNNGQQNELDGGQMRWAVGMAGKGWTGTQPAEQATAGGHSRRTLRPAQASNKQPAVGRPRSKTMAADKVGLPLAVQCR